MYLYCAMADLAGELGDERLRHACRLLWDNLANRRSYITGGVGSTYRNEGFTEDYDLPNDAAYCETCAAIGLIFWNHRLLHVDLDGRYSVSVRATPRLTEAAVTTTGCGRSRPWG
jgi:hypothetical protein